MQYAFVYPAKILVSDKLPRNAKPRSLSYNGREFMVFDNQNLYFCQKSGAIKANAAENSAHYWIVTPDYSFPLSSCWDDESFKSLIDRHAENIDSEIDSRLDSIKNPAEYESRMAVKIAAERESRALALAESDRRVALSREAKAAEDKAALKQAALDYAAGLKISGDHFETLCKANGIAIHMRTLGMIRRRVVSIAHDSASCHGGNLGPEIWRIAKQLKAVL